MAFSVSYYDLLHKNIRHIYSNLPSNIRFRSDPVPGTTLPPHDGCLSLHNRIYQEQKRPPDRLLRRLWAYNPEYRTTLPRAPAFRCVSTSEAKAIVDRSVTVTTPLQ
nr:hypothetical protein BaRGS_013215 [Batillaria attramentaria]